MTDAIEILRCMETGSRLSLASSSLVGEINEAIGRGRIANRLGQTISARIDKALVNESRTLIYRVIDDIPQMVLDEAIMLDQLQE